MQFGKSAVCQSARPIGSWGDDALFREALGPQVEHTLLHFGDVRDNMQKSRKPGDDEAIGHPIIGMLRRPLLRAEFAAPGRRFANLQNVLNRARGATGLDTAEWTDARLCFLRPGDCRAPGLLPGASRNIRCERPDYELRDPDEHPGGARA